MAALRTIPTAAHALMSTACYRKLCGSTEPAKWVMEATMVSFTVSFWITGGAIRMAAIS